MKWILILIVTMSHQNDGKTPIAVDHMTFATQAACETMVAKLQTAPQTAQKSGGFMGAVNAINGALNGPIINARCEGVQDGE